MPEDLDTTWDRIRGELRREVADYSFHIWLEPLELAGRSGERLFVRAPEHIRSWVAGRYATVVAAAARRAGLERAVVEIVDATWSGDGAEEAQATRPAAGEGLNPKYTFDQFVIGDGSRLAHAAALAVAEMPAQAYNPLFIHGPPGLGKTHLLHAIGNYMRVYDPGMTVRYVTVETFTTEFVEALRGRDTTPFKARFRGADVLLVDDVQFMAEKVRTEEEFFHTFNALYESGRQLVLTSDRPPSELGDVESRLRERFACGLVAELEPPDIGVRLAILRKRARLDQAEVGDDVLAAVADHVTSSVRALEGALIRVVAYASLRGERPTGESAREVLRRLYPSASTECTLERIQQATADAFDIPHEALMARDRRPEIARARQVGMYLARELTRESLPSIGRSFGGRGHATVVHAHRKIADDLQHDTVIRSAVEKLRSTLSGPAS